jgi:hypothetical protein
VTGQQFAPQYYIRIFSRGLGEINPTNVISIKTNMATTSQSGDFTIDLDYRNSGLGSLDYFFRIEPQDYVEIYMRREAGSIGRWTEIIKQDGVLTESGKKYLRRDKEGTQKWVNVAIDNAEYNENSVEYNEVQGLDLFKLKLDDTTQTFTNEGFEIDKIKIAKLNFIKDFPLTPSERLYNPDLVMVGLVDNITNNFGLSEESTANSISIKGRTLSKFLLNHSYNSDLAEFFNSLDINHFNSTQDIKTLKEKLIATTHDIGFSELLINLLHTSMKRYTSLINISPAGAAIRIFEFYLATLLGNFKVDDIKWEGQTKGAESFHTKYDIKMPEAQDLEKYDKDPKSKQSSTRIALGIDTSLIEIENPILDPDASESNGSLEIVRDFTELVGTKGYTFIDDEKTMATLHFYDAPWTHIYTSFVNANGDEETIDKNIKKDPWSRISPYCGSNFSGLDNPSLGNGAFFGTTYSLLERLSNSHLNEFFVDEKGFMVLRKQVSAYDQTRYVKKTYEDVRSDAGKCFVDKKYSSYIGLEDENNRLIIKDSCVLNMNLQRDDQMLTSLCIVQPVMMAAGSTISWFAGFRAAMPCPIGYLESLTNYNSSNLTTTVATTGESSQLFLPKKPVIADAARLIDNQLPKSLKLDKSTYASEDIQRVVYSRIVDILWKNKFSSLFSPPILNPNQIINFWQRNGYRVNSIQDYHSHTPLFGLLSSAEVFSKFNNSMWSGSMTVYGDPKYRAGKVVEVPGIPAKFYSYSVSHEFIWGEKFTTTLGLTAGRLIKNADICSKNSAGNTLKTIRKDKTVFQSNASPGLGGDQGA